MESVRSKGKFRAIRATTHRDETRLMTLLMGKRTINDLQHGQPFVQDNGKVNARF